MTIFVFYFFSWCKIFCTCAKNALSSNLLSKTWNSGWEIIRSEDARLQTIPQNQKFYAVFGHNLFLEELSEWADFSKGVAYLSTKWVLFHFFYFHQCPEFLVVSCFFLFSCVFSSPSLSLQLYCHFYWKGRRSYRMPNRLRFWVKSTNGTWH